LAEFLVQSEELSTALIEKLFYFSVQQPIRAYGHDILPTLQRDFVDNNFNLRRLMARIATVAATGVPAKQEQSEKTRENQ
jgi:hypothetical protein